MQQQQQQQQQQLAAGNPVAGGNSGGGGGAVAWRQDTDPAAAGAVAGIDSTQLEATQRAAVQRALQHGDRTNNGGGVWSVAVDGVVWSLHAALRAVLASLRTTAPSSSLAAADDDEDDEKKEKTKEAGRALAAADVERLSAGVVARVYRPAFGSRVDAAVARRLLFPAVPAAALRAQFYAAAHHLLAARSDVAAWRRYVPTSRYYWGDSADAERHTERQLLRMLAALDFAGDDRARWRAALQSPQNAAAWRAAARDEATLRAAADAAWSELLMLLAVPKGLASREQVPWGPSATADSDGALYLEAAPRVRCLALIGHLRRSALPLPVVAGDPFAAPLDVLAAQVLRAQRMSIDVDDALDVLERAWLRYEVAPLDAPTADVWPAVAAQMRARNAAALARARLRYNPILNDAAFGAASASAETLFGAAAGTIKAIENAEARFVDALHTALFAPFFGAASVQSTENAFDSRIAAHEDAQQHAGRVFEYEKWRRTWRLSETLRSQIAVSIRDDAARLVDGVRRQTSAVNWSDPAVQQQLVLGAPAFSRNGGVSVFFASLPDSARPSTFQRLLDRQLGDRARSASLPVVVVCVFGTVRDRASGASGVNASAHVFHAPTPDAPATLPVFEYVTDVGDDGRVLALSAAVYAHMQRVRRRRTISGYETKLGADWMNAPKPTDYNEWSATGVVPRLGAAGLVPLAYCVWVADCAVRLGHRAARDALRSDVFAALFPTIQWYIELDYYPRLLDNLGDADES